jgi:hypothetical protein
MKFPFRNLNIGVFVFGVILGFVCIYIIQKKKRSIVVFPNEDNAGSIQYKDATGTCFHPIPQPVKCPSDPSKIERVRPQST